MPTTTTHGIVKPSSNLEPADMYGVATRLADSVETALTPKYCELTAAAATTGISSATTTKVTLATTVHADADYFTVASSVITILQDGLYNVSGFAALTGTLTNNTVQSVSVGLDGLTKSVAQNVAPPAANVYRATATTLLYALTAGQTLQLNVVATGSSLATAHDTASGTVSRLIVRWAG